MGRAFEFRKARKLKRWGNMAKTFTRIGKQIAIAVKAGGPDPDNNSQKDYKEMNYEGYGPHGIAIYVETLTDNTTRTVANVRSVFTKFGGTLGTSGSLDFIFSHKCQFTIALKDGVDMDDLILELIDLGIEEEYDIDEEENEVTLYGDPKSYAAIQKWFEENGYEVKAAEFTRIPNDLKDVTPEQRETIDKIVERLDEDDDVQNVYTNMKPLDEE